ncbi:flagellar hook-length control protein FliK [Undibacterium sp. Di27W]|uniref:flagellar hook-length control protein FliK n=1 Tax=Undibacterium sp. Di27W TaxID=3413036 RepID=UPI003BF42317
MATQLDILNKPIANIEAPTAAIGINETRQDITPKLAQLVTGQLLKGEILSKLVDGSFTVRVAGITAKMMLPEGSKTGDQIPLRLIATEPRPTFLLEHDGDVHFPTPLPQNYASSPDKRATTNTSNYLGVPAQELEAPGRTTSGVTQNVIPNNTPEPNVRVDTASIVKLSIHELGAKIAEEPGVNPGNTAPQQATTSKSLEINTKTSIIGTNASDINTLAHDIVDTLPSHLSSAPTSLSSTGKFITQILQSAPHPSEKPSLASSVPLLTTATELKDTPATASKLQHQISTSGLFYESHVAEWAQGKRPIADIKAEPQSQIDTISTSSNATGSTLNTVSKEMGQIIHQQLNVLEQNIVRWQGELFPGQKIEWEIKKEMPGKHAQQEAIEDTTWQSVVRFDLPNLGQITATINLQSTNLGLSLRAEQSATVSTLKEHASELAAAMQMAGSPLMSFVVNKNERT